MEPLDSSTLALLRLRCPRCHQAPLFTCPAASLRFSAMPPQCPVCGQSFEPEPGFYFGAMYISTGFAVAVLLLTFVALYTLAGDPATWVYIATVTGVMLLLTPLVFRYSRGLMLYLFGGVRYNRDWARRRQ